MKKQLDKLAALPVRYFMNYCLIAVVGILFEGLVFAVRLQKLHPSCFLQSLLLATVQVTILQTAVEYFRPDGEAGFFLRLGAALTHFVFFSALILLQLDLAFPITVYAVILGASFWLAAIDEAWFRGRGRTLLLSGMYFVLIAVARLLEDATEMGISARWMPFAIRVNIALALILCLVWRFRRRRSETSPRQRQKEGKQ